MTRFRFDYRYLNLAFGQSDMLGLPRLFKILENVVMAVKFEPLCYDEVTVYYVALVYFQ